MKIKLPSNDSGGVVTAFYVNMLFAVLAFNSYHIVNLQNYTNKFVKLKLTKR